MSRGFWFGDIKNIARVIQRDCEEAMPHNCGIAHKTVVSK
jgi:hypothetical protein